MNNVKSTIQQLIWAIAGFGLLYLSTKLSHDLVLGETIIPLTGQSLAVLVIGFSWPGWSGILAIGLYLLVGGLGYPVFANGASGWAAFQDSSGGYLFGFLIAGYFLRNLKIAGWGKSLGWILGAMLVGTLLIMGFGSLRLVQLYGMEEGLKYGFWNLWPGALVKLVVATLICWGVGQLLARASRIK
ncbi:MAG: biotin transporter BioY [Saprospiraceae bacterium]|nr:biotin transporter BioY [Saprospiraceae bacterium]